MTYFFGFCFDHYGIARTADPANSGVRPAVPAGHHLARDRAGALFTRRDLPTQVVLVSSLPLVFLAGFITAPELIPAPLNWLAQWAPSTPAIEGIPAPQSRWAPTLPRSPATGGSCGDWRCCMALWRAGFSAGVNRALQCGRMDGTTASSTD